MTFGNEKGLLLEITNPDSRRILLAWVGLREFFKIGTWSGIQGQCDPDGLAYVKRPEYNELEKTV